MKLGANSSIYGNPLQPNKQVFLCALAVRPHVSGESGIGIPNFFKSDLQSGKFASAKNLESCGRSNPDTLTLQTQIQS